MRTINVDNQRVQIKSNQCVQINVYIHILVDVRLRSAEALQQNTMSESVVSRLVAKKTSVHRARGQLS